MRTKSLIFFSVLALSAVSLAQQRYILRYTESEPLSTFLNRYHLSLERKVLNQDIYSVFDIKGRNSAALVQEISNNSDGDVSIEVDQTVRLPIFDFQRNETAGRTSLLTSFRQSRITRFFGSEVPEGFVRQRAVSQTYAAPSWTIHRGGSGLVAIVDTGVDFSHNALRTALVPGIDLVTRGASGSELTGLPANVLANINPTTIPLLLRDFEHLSRGHAPAWERSVRLNSAFGQIPKGLGHGTMVAGAVRLVAPEARILPIRAFSQNGQGRLFHVIEAIHLAEQRGAKVVNLSLNTYVYSPELERTVEEVSDRGVILVASSGNDGLTNPMSYPARFKKVTSVASVTALNTRSAFSNAGVDVSWVSAPGEGLYLPFPGQRYAGGWGTSFAAPLVSGLASRLFSVKPDATYSDLQSSLGKSTPTNDPDLGQGVLNVFESLSGW